jgi:hypothetical protein
MYRPRWRRHICRNAGDSSPEGISSTMADGRVSIYVLTPRGEASRGRAPTEALTAGEAFPVCEQLHLDIAWHPVKDHHESSKNGRNGLWGNYPEVDRSPISGNVRFRQAGWTDRSK